MLAERWLMGTAIARTPGTDWYGAWRIVIERCEELPHSLRPLARLLMHGPATVTEARMWARSTQTPAIATGVLLSCLDAARDWLTLPDARADLDEQRARRLLQQRAAWLATLAREGTPAEVRRALAKIDAR